MNKPAKYAIGAGVLLATLLTGSAIGQAGAEVPETVTETVTVPGPTETITEEVTPQACLDALDTAEEIVASNAELLAGAGDAIIAASKFNAAGVRAYTAKVKAATPVIAGQVSDYNELAEECRA